MIISGAGRTSATAAVRTGRNDDTPTSGTALVPVIAAVERAPVSRSVARHDAFFIAQLIAMAQHSPQTRVLRRADPQVARDAYHSTTSQKQAAAQTQPRFMRVA